MEALVLAIDVPLGAARRPDPDAFAKGARPPPRQDDIVSTYSPAEYHLLRGTVNALDPGEDFLARLDLFAEALAFGGEPAARKQQSRELFASAASRFKETRVGLSIRDPDDVLSPHSGVLERRAQRLAASIRQGRLNKPKEYEEYATRTPVRSRPTSALPKDLQAQSGVRSQLSASEILSTPPQFQGARSRPLSAADSDTQVDSPAVQRLTRTRMLLMIKAPPGSAERKAAKRGDDAGEGWMHDNTDTTLRKRRRKLQKDIFTANPMTGSYSSCRGAPPLQMD